MHSSHGLRIPELSAAGGATVRAGSADELHQFLRRHRSVAVLTGAGCSTESGIPAYRDADGRWARRQPIFFQDFVGTESMRRRYWARSFLGWPMMRRAAPGPAHRALARLARNRGWRCLVTQNVDGLHQRAGHPAVLELHGTLSRVSCLDCGRSRDRDEIQQQLQQRNPGWRADILELRPDGDAELEERAWHDFRIVACRHCGGVLKPDVVFFGESVPRPVLDAAGRAIEQADALLIIGSSLVVASGYRLARRAAELGKPIVAVNQGRTRADALLAFKLEQDCGEVLATFLD